MLLSTQLVHAFMYGTIPFLEGHPTLGGLPNPWRLP